MKNPILHEIIRKAELASQNREQRLIAIFDLDSTLFDVEPRVVKILKEFSQDTVFQRRYPTACEIIKKVDKLPKEYHVKKYLETFGLSDQPIEFHNDIIQFWTVRFFSDGYLKYDRPYPGASDYVRKLENHGAEIIYLTGRDDSRMGIGTRESLASYQFPLDGLKSRLVLKPHHAMDDAEFKKEFFAKNLFANDGLASGPVYFFENELANIDLVIKHAPHINIVFFDSVHSGNGGPLSVGTPTIQDFLLK